MSALEILTQHFEAQGRQTWVEPETGLELYWLPVTARDQQTVKIKAKGVETAMAAWLVVLKAENADGEKLFSDDPVTVKALISKVDAKVLGAIAAKIMGVDPDDPDAEDDLGND